MSHQLNEHGNDHDVPVDEERKIDHDVSHDVVEPIEISEEDNKRVLRKIDCVVLPLASLVYFCQYLDKRGLSFAAIFGLQKDLNLKGQDYSYVAFQSSTYRIILTVYLSDGLRVFSTSVL